MGEAAATALSLQGALQRRKSLRRAIKGAAAAAEHHRHPAPHPTATLTTDRRATKPPHARGPTIPPVFLARFRQPYFFQAFPHRSPLPPALPS